MVHRGQQSGELTEQECRDLLTPGELDWKLGSSRQVEILFKAARGVCNSAPWIASCGRCRTGLTGSDYEVVKRDNPAWRDVQETQTLAMRFKDSLIANRDRFQGNRSVIVQTRGRNVELQFALFAVPVRA